MVAALVIVAAPAGASAQPAGSGPGPGSALVAPALSARAPARVDPDPWWGPDKALHFGATAALAAGGYVAGALAFDDYLGPAALGSGLALGAGIAKELLDLAGIGDPSWKDLTWDLIGTAAGVGVALSIHVAVRETSAPAAAR